jgi:hypothetical protein
MAAKPIMGKLLPFPVRGTKAGGIARPRLDDSTSEMIAAEHALFVALRLAQKRGSGDQPPIQPPPRTSSSRKKTAA